MQVSGRERQRDRLEGGGEVFRKRKRKRTVVVSRVKFYSNPVGWLQIRGDPIRETSAIGISLLLLPLLLLSLTPHLMCLELSMAPEFPSYSNKISPPQGSTSRTGSSAAVSARGGSDPTKLVRLSGEQAQFECQLSPLANNIIQQQQQQQQLDPEANEDAQIGNRRGVTASSRRRRRHLVIDESRARSQVAGLPTQTAPLSEPPSPDPDLDLATGAAGETQTAHLQMPRRSAPIRSRRPSASSASSFHFANGRKQLLSDEDREDSFRQLATPESVEFILWYHSVGESKLQQPIYSVDARRHQTMPNSAQPHLQPTPSHHDDNNHQPQSSSSLIPVVWRQVQQVQQQQGRPTQPQKSGGRSESSSSLDNGLNKPSRIQIDQAAGGNISIIEQPSSSSGKQLNYSGSGGGSQYNSPPVHQEEMEPEELGGGSSASSSSSDFLRNVISGDSKHYAQAKLGPRIRMLINGTSAHLIMDRVEPGDSGLYKCRVDFRFARTRYQLSQLDVIAPVTLLQIRATGQHGIDLRPAAAAAGTNSTLLAASIGSMPLLSGGNQTGTTSTLSSRNGFPPSTKQQWAPMEQKQQHQRANDYHQNQSQTRQDDGKRLATHSNSAEQMEDEQVEGGRGLKSSQHQHEQQQQQRHRHHHHRHHNNHHHHQSNLNHDPPANGNASGSPQIATGQSGSYVEHKFVGLVEANEDETMNLECTAKDGWPKSRIGLWRADWPQVDMDTRRPLVPRLRPVLWSNGEETAAADGSNSLLVPNLPIDDTMGPDGAGEKFGDATSTKAAPSGAAGHSINTGHLWPGRSHVSSSSTNSSTSRPPNNNNFRPQTKSGDPPAANLNSSHPYEADHDGDGQEDDEWLAWMGGHLSMALSKFIQNLDKQAGNSTASSFSSPMTQFAASMQSTLSPSPSSDHEDIIRDSWSNRAASRDAVGMDERRPEVEAANSISGGDLEFRRLLRQNELILYVCGASNTYYHHRQQQQQQQRMPLSQGQRDKLANIRPIFTSIFVRPNARPKWIQMFLVGRRSVPVGPDNSSSSSKTTPNTAAQVGAQIELTPLDASQSIQLNLAPFGKGERQLQFACQVGGSLPEAKIVWTRTYAAATATATADKPDVIESSGPLASGADNDDDDDDDDGSRFESLSLNPQMASLDGARARFRVTAAVENKNKNKKGKEEEGADETEAGYYYDYSATNSSSHNSGRRRTRPTQWSLLRLHNISLTDHGTIIACSAFNDRFVGGKNSGASGGHPTQLAGSTKLGTFVKLNITHLPVLKLELELDDRDGYNNSISATTTTTIETNEIEHNYSYTNDDYDPNSDQGDEQARSTRVLYGQNVTLACGVAFANPALQEPGIEWSLNDTRLLIGDNNIDKANSGRLVVVVERIQLDESQLQQLANQNSSPAGGRVSGGGGGRRRRPVKYHFVEKLTVQFIDSNSQQQQFQLKCLARNAIGQATSNRVRLVIGQLPHCPSSNQFNNSSATAAAITTNSSIIIANNGNGNGSSSSNRSDKSDFHSTTTKFDKNLFVVHCPVISDKGSSIFHWLVASATKSGGIITQSPRAQIEMSKLNLPNEMGARVSLGQDNNDYDNNNNNNNNENVFQGLKISCWASDKFGSNHNNGACQTILVPKSSPSNLPAHGEAADYNCLANVVSSTEFYARQQQQQQQPEPQDNGSSSGPKLGIINGDNVVPYNQLINTTSMSMSMKAETTTSYNEFTTKTIYNQLVATTANKAGLFISIECKVNQFKGVGVADGWDKTADGWMIHLDLYHRRTFGFIKHLASYPNKAISSIGGLSVVLDLGYNNLNLMGDNQSSSSLESELLIVMSTTDANRNLIKPNVTLQLNTVAMAPEGNEFITPTTNSAGHATEALDRAMQPLLLLSANKQTGGGGGNGGTQIGATTDRFPRTSDPGHRDRLWVISSILATFSGSFVLVIIAWVCKSTNGNGSMGNNNNININNIKSQGPKGIDLANGLKSNGGSGGSGGGGGSSSTSTSGSGSCNSNSNSTNGIANSSHHHRETNGQQIAIDSLATEIYLLGPEGTREALVQGGQAIYHNAHHHHHHHHNLRWAGPPLPSQASFTAGTIPSCNHREQADGELASMRDPTDPHQMDCGITKRAFISLAQAPAPATVQNFRRHDLSNTIDSMQQQTLTGESDTCARSGTATLKQQVAPGLQLMDPANATAAYSSLSLSSSCEQDRESGGNHHQQLYSPEPEAGNSNSSATITTLLADPHHQYYHHHHRAHHLHLHTEPMVHVHPAEAAVSIDLERQLNRHQDAILRAPQAVGGGGNCCSAAGLLPNVCDGILMSRSESSNSGHGNTISLGYSGAGGSGSGESSGGRMQNFSLFADAHHHRLPAPKATAASPGGGGLNFELNSQGELTMTDESSSFVHEEPAIELVGGQPAFPVSSLSSGWAASVAMAQQPAFGSNCLECRRKFTAIAAGGDSGGLVRVIETDLNNNNNNADNHPGTLIFQCHGQHLSSLSGQRQQQQKSLSSTLKRDPAGGGGANASEGQVATTSTTARRTERVRFVDYQFDEHDSSCC